MNHKLNPIINRHNNCEDEAQSLCLYPLCLHTQTFVSAQGLPSAFLSVNVIIKQAHRNLQHNLPIKNRKVFWIFCYVGTGPASAVTSSLSWGRPGVQSKIGTTWGINGYIPGYWGAQNQTLLQAPLINPNQRKRVMVLTLLPVFSLRQSRIWFWIVLHHKGMLLALVQLVHQDSVLQTELYTPPSPHCLFCFVDACWQVQHLILPVTVLDKSPNEVLFDIVLYPPLRLPT